MKYNSKLPGRNREVNHLQRYQNQRPKANKMNSTNQNFLQSAGAFILRYALVLVLLWIGAMKFTDYEAMGIMPLVSNSPVMSWALNITSINNIAKVLGVIEILTGVLIALGRFVPKISFYGSCGAIIIFIITLSFLFTTPGWEPTLGGFPALSANPGQFLLKDIVLLGSAVWTAGEALQASKNIAGTSPNKITTAA